MLWLVLSRFRNVSGIPVIIFKLSVNVSSLEKTPSLYLLATIVPKMGEYEQSMGDVLKCFEYRLIWVISREVTGSVRICLLPAYHRGMKI